MPLPHYFRTGTLPIKPLLVVYLAAFGGATGLWAYTVVIASDVVINCSFLTWSYGIGHCFNFFTISQVLFLLFVAVTKGPIDRDLGRRNALNPNRKPA